MTTAPPRAFLRARDVAPLLGVCVARVYQLMQEGELPSISIGRTVVIPRPAWDRWLEEKTQQALARTAKASQPKPPKPPKKPKPPRKPAYEPKVTRLAPGVSRQEWEA